LWVGRHDLVGLLHRVLILQFDQHGPGLLEKRYNAFYKAQHTLKVSNPTTTTTNGTTNPCDALSDFHQAGDVSSR
jgi:hypothetical protein